MSSDCIIRNYHPDDFNTLVQLKNEAASLAADGRYLSPQAVCDTLGRPNYTPEQDLFIAEISGALVGYLDITDEARIGRVVLECLVLSEHRQQGVSEGLYRQALPRMKALGAKVAHVNVHEDNTLVRLVLEKMGFNSIRRFYELEIDLDIITESSISTNFPIHPLQAGEEATLTELQNLAYAGSWGYNPNTVEEIGYTINTAGNATEGICLAQDQDRPVGYFWVRIEHDKQGKHRGRVSMLGTDPDYRGRGIGRELLLAGLSFLKSRGPRVAQLTVDSENLVAESLYRSIGFTRIDSSLWYEKVLY
ncbi:MAG: GNAT family N-acetyltransferase [Dehalococcoidales bacterium]|nr:MAG: GNAT family N-acetyltransferase [Dehalococcoidales bacterium]